MSEYDPTELFAYCDAILEDSEVSVDEVYGFAEWMNANPTACDHWPGNVLVGPLQAMWADGETTETELRSFAKVLTGLQKERQRREREQATHEAQSEQQDRVASAVLKFDPSLPWIPPIAAVLSEKSQSEVGRSYRVDLGSQTCTCPDWVGNRDGRSLGSPARFCKHMLSALGRVSPNTDWPDWLGFLTDHAYRISPRSRVGVVRVPGGVVLVVVSDGDWCDVIAPDSGGYGRFGFNRSQHRWSYGEAPDGARAIRNAIKELVGNGIR